MIISIWRYSHLTLAISSFIFILIASITGIVLAFEPIVEQVQPYSFDLRKHTLAQTISALEKNYEEVITIEKDHNDFIIASVITNDGSDERFYINPATGKKVGEIIERAPIFQFMTNLHRSLFLKSTGRGIIGIASFLLFLIAITGSILIIKRQGGLVKFFSKVVKEDKHQYYHVVLSRYCLIPIIILTLTGVYLSLEKFSLLPSGNTSHSTDFKKNRSSIKLHPTDFTEFKNISLDNLKQVEFPFSDDPEDYFSIRLESKELIVDQYSGVVLSEIKHPFIALASSLSLALHTGRGNILWSIILLVATGSTLYFIYSGFVMTLHRRKQNLLIPKNFYDQNEAEYIILVGSETGSTYQPAKLVFDALKSLNQKVFITELNRYALFKNMKHLLIFTSTYGTGEAPSNATQFLKKLRAVKNNNNVKYSLVGFGSLAYPDFCEFAIDIDKAMQEQQNFSPSTSLYKIHNQSLVELKKWASEWSKKVGLTFQLKDENHLFKLPKQQKLEVIHKTDLNKDATFLLRIRPSKRIKYQSGDLLKIYPPNEAIPRYYSIGSIHEDMLLSVKKHDLGICSNLLHQLEIGNILEATIDRNKGFHFPKKGEVILIANGTGIAPFLGMINENKNQIKTHLFWGGRNNHSYNLYRNHIEEGLSQNKLSSLHIAYSREGKKQYVQHLIERNSNLIARVLSEKGTVMICGSLAMEIEVKEALEFIIKSDLKSTIKKYSDQITSDCY